ncbi:MAG: hypothetical protein ACRYGP_32895 [Janthinobacterium lividum]
MNVNELAKEADLPVRSGASTGSKPDEAAPEVVVRRAGEGASAGRYDSERMVFLAPDGFAGGSTEPRRVRQASGKPDPLMDRAIKMLETPGLIHAMILAERRQEVIDVDTVSVPERALGFPQADAYRDHVFSSDAFDELSDPDKAEAFLRNLTSAD